MVGMATSAIHAAISGSVWGSGTSGSPNALEREYTWAHAAASAAVARRMTGSPGWSARSTPSNPGSAMAMASAHVNQRTSGLSPSGGDGATDGALRW